MPNEDTSSGESVTPTPDTPVTGTPASSGVTPEKPNVTLEEALARIAELERSHKNAREAEDRLGKKLAAYEKAEQEKKDAELSELERAKKQLSELQSQHNTYTQQMQERIIRYEVQAQAAKLGIIDPDAAVKLLDWSALELNDDGTPTNADKLLEKLLKQKPYLAPKQEAQQPEQTPPARGNATPAIPAMNPGRTQIAPPGSVPPGKIPRLSDIYRRPQ